MFAQAYIKYVRVSPKKIKALGSCLVGLPPQDALDRLSLLRDKKAHILSQAIRSAMLNATNNAKLGTSSLRLKSVEVLKGPFFKRWQPVSRGMAHQIKKRTAHIRVTVEETPKKIETQVKTKINQAQKKEVGKK